MPLTNKTDSVIPSQENIIWPDSSKTCFGTNKDGNMQFYSVQLVYKTLNEMFNDDQIKAEIP